MTCPRNSMILRLLSGELEPDGQREFREHLETCPVCRSAYEGLQASWDVLGGWRVDLSAIDLTERVLADADVQDRRLGQPIRLAAYWTVPLRVAASILLAVGLGVGAGNLVPTIKPETVSEPQAAFEGVDEALEWVGLASESATGLLFGLEPDETQEGAPTP
ncbi:MAG: zf-HC2 domain-containing protein [Phycisphaerae bacterium]|nr:zf-HC2 domain-containing protein [Phycisphaerae bacterium]